MSRPIRVLIVDDESLGRERVRRLLEDHGDVEVVGECENGVEAVRAIEEFSPDLVFLDVQMPELDGVGVLKMLGDDRVPEVIFTTAHAEYMERAFEAHAIDYLRKPYRDSRFEDALHHAWQRIQARRAIPPEFDPRIRAFLAEVTAERSEKRIRIQEKNGEYRFLWPGEVLFMEADKDYVQVYTSKETITWRTTLSEAGQGLDPVFLRVHRSYIVNTSHVRRVSRLGKGEYFLEMENGKKVGTGRSYRETVEAFVNG
jgi:two-component system LytT family response regulator